MSGNSHVAMRCDEVRKIRMNLKWLVGEAVLAQYTHGCDSFKPRDVLNWIAGQADAKTLPTNVLPVVDLLRSRQRPEQRITPILREFSAAGYLQPVGKRGRWSLRADSSGR